MKKRKTLSKLHLNKETIAALTDGTMNQIKGGMRPLTPQGCHTDTQQTGPSCDMTACHCQSRVFWACPGSYTEHI